MRECPQAEHTGDTACRGGVKGPPKKECYFIILRTFQLNTQAFTQASPHSSPLFFQGPDSVRQPPYGGTTG